MAVNEQVRLAAWTRSIRVAAGPHADYSVDAGMRRLTPTRRDLLRLAGGGAVGLGLGCGDNLDGDDDLGSHATAIVEAGPTSFRVALWSARTRRFAIEARSPGRPSIRTAADLDPEGLGTVEVGGLQPATTYRVTVRASTGARLEHRVRTAPLDDDPGPVRLAVTADLDPAPEYDSELGEHVAAAEPDLLVSLGDFPYCDNGPVPQTLADYRSRHVEARTAPRFRRLLAATSVRAIYDDHEFHNDWDQAVGEAEPGRLRAALQAWDEFFPMAAREVRYRSWRWGAHVESFLLDTRRYRSANAAVDDAEKTMLGATQEAWLTSGVRASTATFKLIFTSVPLDFGVGIDHWASFVTARTRLFDALAGVSGVLFVTGDQHLFAAHRHQRGIRELQVGPFARGPTSPPPGPPGVLFRASRYNVGLLDVDGETLTVSGLGDDGSVFYQERLSPADLTPRSPRLP